MIKGDQYIQPMNKLTSLEGGKLYCMKIVFIYLFFAVARCYLPKLLFKQ